MGIDGAGIETLSVGCETPSWRLTTYCWSTGKRGGGRCGRIARLWQAWQERSGAMRRPGSCPGGGWGGLPRRNAFNGVKVHVSTSWGGAPRDGGRGTRPGILGVGL